MNPIVGIAKGASAQEREQNDVRRPALLIQNRRQHRGFVGSLQNQRREWFPMRRRYTAVSHGKGGAEGLRDDRPLFPFGIGDCYVAVYSDAKLGPQSIPSAQLRFRHHLVRFLGLRTAPGALDGIDASKEGTDWTADEVAVLVGSYFLMPRSGQAAATTSRNTAAA